MLEYCWKSQTWNLKLQKLFNCGKWSAQFKTDQASKLKYQVMHHIIPKDLFLSFYLKQHSRNWSLAFLKRAYSALGSISWAKRSENRSLSLCLVFGKCEREKFENKNGRKKNAKEINIIFFIYLVIYEKFKGKKKFIFFYLVNHKKQLKKNKKKIKLIICWIIK